jgi:uncharacterized protein YqeY
MGLKEQITTDIKKALISKDKVALRALRAVKSAILLSETEKGSAQKLTKDQEVSLLMKASKQRKDSVEIYEQQNREDLATPEREEIIVIESYLPKQLSDEDLIEAIKDIISDFGATSTKDMGKVIGKASSILKGQADGKRISVSVKKLLTL